MSGKETDDEQDRAAIWDCIYNDGPKYPHEVNRITGIHFVRVASLTNHPWFWRLDGQIRIAYAQKHAAIR
jgi:hypothetical protein